MTRIDISADQKATWRDDGVVCLTGVIGEEWLHILNEGFDESLEHPGELSKDYAKADKGSFFTDHDMHRRIEKIHRFIFDSPLSEMAATLMEASRVNLIDDHLLIKEPETQNPTYWHQDQPYFQFAGEQFMSLWIPLDPVDRENGAMRFVKGSHRWGTQYQPVRIGLGELVEDAEKFDGPAPDIDGEPDKYDTVFWNLSVGDCLAFQGNILHGAFPNSSQSARRRALSVRFAGDDIRWQPRAYAPTDPHPPPLKAGDKIDCDKYPLVWQNIGQAQ